MIRKLRVKFIAMSMLSLLVVLLAIMGSVNLVNYQGIVEDADQVLDILVDNNGSFPRQENQKQGDGSAPPSDSGLGGLRELSPELPYESRYFSVLLNSEGEVETVDTGKIAAVDTSAAIEYAQEAVSRGTERGFLSDYRYAITSDESGTRVIFLDCGRNLSTFYTFLKASCGISAVGLAAVLLLMVLFSGRIIRPVAESYDKQRRFITDAGHELKTPLTIIDADAEVLEMDIGENEWLQDIRRQTDRLAKLTGALIALSRMEEGEEQFQMIDFPISDVVGETAQSFQALAKTQNKRFESSIQPLLTLHGDENAIRQLTGILLDNALKYSPEGGRDRSDAGAIRAEPPAAGAQHGGGGDPGEPGAHLRPVLPGRPLPQLRQGGRPRYRPLHRPDDRKRPQGKDRRLSPERRQPADDGDAAPVISVNATGPCRRKAPTGALLCAKF